MSKSSKRKNLSPVSFPTFTTDDFDLSDDTGTSTKPPKRPRKTTKHAITTQFSSDHRRVITTHVELPPISPLKTRTSSIATSSMPSMKPVSSASSFDFTDFARDSGLILDSVPDVLENKSRPRSKKKKNSQVMAEWHNLRDDYLEQFMWLEGRDDAINRCHCKAIDATPIYRCRECFSTSLYCKKCILESHKNRPLDRIEKWNGKFFECVLLRDLGLIVQLGHADGSNCLNPIQAPSNFTVIHINGFHRVSVNYCGCYRASGHSHPRQQLLRYQWYPATHRAPQTCFSFRVLENFHAMTLLGKITSYDYYRALKKLTNDLGTFDYKDRYESFRRAIQQFRHLRMLKRGGRGNSAPIWVSETAAGELALRCPACPRKGVNLPDGWQQSDPDNRPGSLGPRQLEKCSRELRVVRSLLDAVLDMRSFNQTVLVIYKKGNDGEGIETNWAGQGPITTSTTEMGPGSRHDTLDDQWGQWNWDKTKGLGSILLRHRKQAVDWAARQRCSFALFSRNQASQLPSWTKMVEDFEADSSKPNPYYLPKPKHSIQDVRRELSQEDAAYTIQNASQSISPSEAGEFILLALEIEERQHQLKEEIAFKRSGGTSRQFADIVDKRNRLRKLLIRYERKQNHHMPIVSGLRAGADVDPLEPETHPLYLPSQLSVAQLATCLGPDLSNIECRLRNAQCAESLDELRNQLLIKSRLRTYKGLHARHQGRLRKSNTLLRTNESKIRLHVRRYQDAWLALRILCDREGTTMGWRSLKISDIRCMGDDEDRAIGNPRKNTSKMTGGTQRAVEVMGQGNSKSSTEDEHEDEYSGEEEESEGEEEEVVDENETEEQAAQRWRRKRDEVMRLVGEGKKVTSWIWAAADGGGFTSDEVLYAGLWVEWARSRARMKRWEEEILLLDEEMRRTLTSLEWTTSRWYERASTGIEGKDAYAFRQATQYRLLAARFKSMWYPSIEGKGKMLEIATHAVDDIDKGDDMPGDIDDEPLRQTQNDYDFVVEEEEEGDAEEPADYNVNDIDIDAADDLL
ncbi:hypothetical protein VNI00_015540 [Paramarasmius palmivorus]|uniref:CxC2-like cysteine cluster KDZ transposase-associated domain-containing protein n=1 Tax=Paramarasmius palmivorus TaxID=297713 RepID=A0AAW0BKC1_9AGAR